MSKIFRIIYHIVLLAGIIILFVVHMKQSYEIYSIKRNFELLKQGLVEQKEVKNE